MDEKTKKRLFGACVGVILALLLLHYGFFGTLFIILMGALGWWLVAGHPVPDSLKNALSGIGKDAGANEEQTVQVPDPAPEAEDKE